MLLYHAAHQSHNKIRILFFGVFEHSKSAIDTILSMFTNRTGIHEDDIGFGDGSPFVLGTAHLPALIRAHNLVSGFLKQAFGHFLPPEIITKKKHGFGLPFIGFVQDHPPIRDLAFDSLAALKKRGYFRPDYIDELIGGPGVGAEGSFDGITWDLMILELWLAKHASAVAAAPAYA